MRGPVASIAAVMVLLAACGDEADLGLSDGERIVAEAAVLMPDYLSFHSRVIARTCGPDGGVCHNAKEYPDLHTAGNMLDSVGKRCNLAESEPDDVADMCEPQGDILVIETGAKAGFTGRIAWHGVVDDAWVMRLDSALGTCAPYQARFRISYGDGSDQTVLAIEDAALRVDCAADTVSIPGFTSVEPEIQQALLRRVRMGDPNQNGTLGYADAGALVVPGDPDRSYLLQRVLGTVPGTIMPLANQPLDDREILALFCWIETVEDAPSVYDAIDYAGCRKAAEVIAQDGLELPLPWHLQEAP